MKTAELDAAEVAVSSPAANDYLEFDDDQAFLTHIVSQRPPEEVVVIPEWNIKILCKALNAKSRLEAQIAAYDEQSKKTDYRRAIYEVIMAGCFNPKTGHKAFRESHRAVIMQDQDGRAAEKLFMTIMRLSGMFASDAEKTKKN